MTNLTTRPKALAPRLLAALVLLPVMSNPLVAQLPPPPNPVTVTPGCTSIRLSWSPVPQAFNYYIRRNTVNNQATATTVACGQPNSYVDSNVSFGVTYWYFVGSNNGVGCGNGAPGAGVSGQLLTVLPAPTGVTASIGACSQVVINWTLVAGATGYSVYRHTTSASGSATRIGQSTTSPFVDSTAQPGSQYFYWLRTDNACGQSGLSGGAAGSAAPDPGIPVAVAAGDDVSCTAVDLTWGAATNATSYRLYRNTQNSSAGRTQIGTAAATQFSDTTAQPGVTYWYWVRGVNACSLGGYSAADAGRRAACATVQTYGIGCGSPSLQTIAAAGSRPVVGQVFASDILQVPAGIAFIALGGSDATFQGTALPLSLTAAGMPGCSLLQSADNPLLSSQPTGPTTARSLLAIPNLGSLVGARVYLQAWAPAPAQNPAGIIVGNGLSLSFGNL